MIYAINKRTKEHRRYSEATFRPSHYENEWEVMDADDDGWIEWHGGECPLPEGISYQTKHESGAFFEGDRPESFGVHWRGKECDAVISYRPIVESKVSHPGMMAGPDKYRAPAGEWPEPLAWDGEGLPPVGCECEVRGTPTGSICPAVIDYIDDKHCIWHWKDGRGETIHARVSTMEFRPIRSEEDKVVDDMLEIGVGMTRSSIFCRALYRAGYRKHGD